MVKSKKLLSLFLAIVMVLSVFTVMASAYTMGAEDPNAINVKYSVEKAESAPMADGSDAYTGDDIYAVTVYGKAAKGIDTFTAPVHFNKEHFSPILYVEGDMYVGTDTWAGDFGVPNSVYSLGGYMQNVNMYDKDGNVTTKTMSAVAYGLGNAKATAVGVVTEYISADHSLYNKWHAGLADNVGVMYVQIDASKNAKNCYLNVYDSCAPSSDYVSMFTFYFQRNEGVTDADVIGDEFGVYTADCFTVDGTVDGSGQGYYTSATYSKDGYNPTKNVVSNAVIEESIATSIIKPLKGQMRYANSEKTLFDVRALAYISGTDFETTFGDKAAAEAKITEAGFVFAAGSNVPAPEMSVVEDIVKNYTDGNGKDGYLKKEIHTISTSIKSGDYVLSCMIPDITKEADYNNSLIAVAYIVYTDAEGATQYIYYDAAQTIEFKPLFDSAK